MKGTVYLVGAGPGDPELLTLKAAHLLRTADAVLYDDLVAPEVLQLVPASAQLHNVGKRCGTKHVRQEQINFLMIALAEAGLQVVRLKGGDPSIFGRAGEEIEALRRAHIPYEVVPGITSALGAAAATGVSLTHRDISSAVIFLTVHHATGHHAFDWTRLVSQNSTLVIYMPGRDHAAVAQRLVAAGLDPATPCLIVSRATTPSQQTELTTVRQLKQAPQLPAPSLLIVGEVARAAQRRDDRQLSILHDLVLPEANSSALEEPPHEP